MPVQFPAPYFGAKSAVAAEVWRRFGNVYTYVEPFAGSLAVLLGRPDEHLWWNRIETVGDYSGLVANFHRAVALDPQTVIVHASYPVVEADLTARHLYLVRYQNELAERLAADPDFFDARVAGWWVWGMSAWVGGEWCSGLGPWKPGDPDGPGVYRKMPMVHGTHSGKGVHRKIGDPQVGPGQVSAAMDAQIGDQLLRLSDRLRRVRVTCGDWERLTRGAASAPAKEFCGVFLDPPYDMALRRGNLYGPDDVVGSGDGVWTRARRWALEQSTTAGLRIAYCSYSTVEEEAQFTEAGWSAYRWTAQGGYGLQSQNEARDNRDREIIWFSPSCLLVDVDPSQGSLFE